MRWWKIVWFYLRTTRQQRDAARMMAQDLANLPIRVYRRDDVTGGMIEVDSAEHHPFKNL